MNFATIAPTEWMRQRLPMGRGCFMALAQWMRQKDYAEEVLRIRANFQHQGGVFILDNGAYEEEQVSHITLIEEAKRLHPDFLVIPDTPNNFAVNETDCRHFVTEYAYLNIPFLKIIHGATRDELLASYFVALTDKRIQAIGISRLTNPKILAPDASALLQPYIDYDPRASFFSSTLDIGASELYTHAFGCPGGLTAIEDLAKAGFDSVDGSGPIWRGLYGYTLSDSDTFRWREDFDVKFQVDAGINNNSPGQVIASRNVADACKAADSTTMDGTA